MKRSSLVHGAWCVAAITAFVLGAKLLPGANRPSESNAGLPSETKSQRALDRDDRSRGGSGATAKQHRDGRSSGDSNADLPARPILSEQDIATLGEQFRGSPNPVERRLAFSRLLQGLTPENARLMREQVAHLSDNSAEFKEFHYAWGAIAGADAVMHGADTEKSDMAATLSGWAGASPDAAARWFNEMHLDPNQSDAHKKNLAVGLVHGLADADPDFATRFIVDLDASTEGKAAWMINIVASTVIGNEGATGASVWAENLPPGSVRAGALGRIAQDYARKDPQAAVNWLQSMGSSEDIGYGMQSAFSSWAGKDPTTAGARINQMPDSPARDWAVSGFAPRVAFKDPASGIRWAESIDDPAVREQALIRTAQVYYHHGDTKAAREWLPNSGLSPEAQKKVMHRRR